MVYINHWNSTRNVQTPEVIYNNQANEIIMNMSAFRRILMRYVKAYVKQ